MLKIRIEPLVDGTNGLFALVHLLVSHPDLMDDFGDPLFLLFSVDVPLKLVSRIHDGEFFHCLAILQQMVHALHHRVGIVLVLCELNLSHVDRFQGISVDQRLVVEELYPEGNVKNVPR